MDRVETEQAELLRDAAQRYMEKLGGESEIETVRRMAFAEGQIIALTLGMDEHPGFLDDIPCYCDECRMDA